MRGDPPAPFPAWTASVLVASLLVSGCLVTQNGPKRVQGAESSEDPSPAEEAWARYLSNLTPESSQPMPEIPDTGHPGDRSVVAVVDSGTDAFHAAFQRPSLQAPGSLPVEAHDHTRQAPPVYVPIHQVGDVQRGSWLAEELEPRTLYRLAGTPLLFYSTLEDVNDLDTRGHGTAVTGTVLHRAPHAIVVVVQASADTLPDAIAWTAKQPWIDVVNLSWGCPANCLPFHAADRADVGPAQFDAIVEATAEAHRSGKLVVASAGNDPTPHVTDPIDGPPWVLAVGGVDPHRRGETLAASKAPDVVANYTVQAPKAGSQSGQETISGTSFAAPTVAGTLADAIDRLRSATDRPGSPDGGSLVDLDGRQVTTSTLREALNRTSHYWNATAWDPTAEHPDGPRAAGAPVTPAAPWLQMGWGYVARDQGETIAQTLLSGELPTKPPAAQVHMDTVQTAREDTWRGTR